MVCPPRQLVDENVSSTGRWNYFLSFPPRGPALPGNEVLVNLLSPPWPAVPLSTAWSVFTAESVPQVDDMVNLLKTPGKLASH